MPRGGLIGTAGRVWQQAQQETCLTAPIPDSTLPVPLRHTHLKGLSHTVQLGQKVLVTVASQQLRPEGTNR